MADTYECPVEGCGHVPFKSLTGMKSHVRSAHPEHKGGEGEAREVPIVEEDFAALLRKFKIKGDLSSNIAENIAHTGGPSVFEDPELLFKRLTAWSSDVNPARRKLIIEQWFAEKGIAISPEVQQKAGMTTEQINKAETETKTTSEVRYIYEPESRQIRMAKKDEQGGTLSQAKELKKMAEEDEKAGAQSPFMQDAEGRWILNPQARVTGVELMAVQFMQQSQQKGEPVDPITAMTRAAETWKTLREGLGGGGGTQPAWMTDPVAFVEAIRKITGGSEGDSALKTALADMRQSVNEMKEQRYQDQFSGQQKQIQDLANVLKQTMQTLTEVQKGRVGRSEMDIIHEIVTGGKEELSGLRRDVKDAFASSSLPPRKSTDEREDRKRRVKKDLKTDEDIEEVGKRLFFPQS